MAQTLLLLRVSAAAGLSKHVAEAEAGLKGREFFNGASLRSSALSVFLPEVRGVQLRTGSPGKVLALFPKKVAAAKKKASGTEDGIFGTSGGIGFTKQNELFVGRVAMIGFAASILGEALSGKGTLAQFDIETGIPLYETEPLLIFFILFTLLGAIGALGDRGKFVDEPSTGGVIPPGKGLKSALGLQQSGPLQTPFGFTKANELFVGRLAQLGIAFSIIGEIITGKGTLAQLNFETGVPITELEPIILFQVIFFFIAAINPGTGKFISDDEE
jgi:photosystem II protein